MDDVFNDIFGDIFHHGKSQGFSGTGGAGRGTSGEDSVTADSRMAVSTAAASMEDSGVETSRRKDRICMRKSQSDLTRLPFGCDKIIRLQDPNSATGAVQSLKVHIPAGIDSGKSVRLRGKGMPGTNGGENV